MELPAEIELVRDAARSAIAPVRPADAATKADKDFLLTARRTDASDDLPPYYLVYFLLVDLLHFQNLGQFEKVAWSVPIDFDGQAFLIEHRKFGAGVFAHNPGGEAAAAQQIVLRIKKGVRTAEPFFDWIAEKALQNSTLNVENRSTKLFSRFEYFAAAYAKTAAEASERANEHHVERREIAGGTLSIYHTPAMQIKENAKWLALAAVDAFFSWTEHVFIHIAILRGNVTTGIEVAELADADWQEKFKGALDLSDPRTKRMFDELLELRRQLRNFIAHGAFGKKGEAFSFHSGAGAVPLLLPHKAGKKRFAIGDDLIIADADALALMERFIPHLWADEREPAFTYIQKSGLPLVLTHARDGTYKEAMKSVDSMQEFVRSLSHEWDRSVNMDW